MRNGCSSRFERILHVQALPVGEFEPVLDELAVRLDVEVPLAELVDLALLLAHDHRRARLSHPCELSFSELRVLLIGNSGEFSLQFLDPLRPQGQDEVVESYARDLVDAHDHGLAGLPLRRVVPHEVLGDLLQALLCGDDVVFALELALQALLDVHVLDLGFLECVRDLLVQVGRCDPELVAARIVVERDGGAILDGALEVVGADVVPEDFLRDLVLFEQAACR